MDLDHIIDQKLIKQELRRLVTEDQLPHAILLHGPRSNGKLALALWLTRYLMCDQPDTSDACGACSNCVKVAKLIHPDVHFSYPIYPKNKEKTSTKTFLADWRNAIQENLYLDINDWMTKIGGQTRNPNISAFNCLEIIRSMGLKSYQGKHKVMIVWMAEYLDKDGNRLLKLIEEPTDGTFLILIAEEVDRILNTIRSRCLQIFVGQLTEEAIEQYLIEEELADKQQAKWIAQWTEGNINEAIRMSTQQDEEIHDIWVEWMRFGIKWSNAPYIQWVNNFSRLHKQSQRMFFRYGLLFVKRLLHHKAGMQKSEDRVIEVLKERLDWEQINSLAALCEECLFSLERNGNASILMTDAGIKLKNIIQQNKSVSYGM